MLKTNTHRFTYEEYLASLCSTQSNVLLNSCKCSESGQKRPSTSNVTHIFFSFSVTLRSNISVQSKTMILIMDKTIFGCLLASYVIFINSLTLNCFNLLLINNYQHP
ncbi:uncharacterized protein Smp_201520 [Schistosoma mansoni]|uniref:Smp_201520 n=1 Tax=Schistosoma mansoni TaxID=6183 RepID=G4VCC7_SCHMA|nr:uncharacterized protein Smp_201520 [Schistosoma mansoni]|eukprot:XP_018650175.1 uncharacterized protein Smp_201520 [Schistosoma mansoni]